MSSRLEQLYNRLEHISNLEGDKILSDAQELLELSRSEKKLHGEALAFLIIGQYRLSRGEYKEAKKLFESALTVSEGHFEKPFRGRILSALGGAYCKMDQYGKSLRYLFRQRSLRWELHQGRLSGRPRCNSPQLADPVPLPRHLS